MKLKHKVRINIADRHGHKQEVLQSSHVSLPKRLLRFLFGEFSEVLVLTPGESVESIEIKEVGVSKEESSEDKRGDGND